MATGTTIETDRPASGRFVRSLALSLSGGALLTVAGAAVAAADDASTASDGAGTAGTGDATAVGNSSGTKTNQGVAPGSGSSSPAVVTQTAGAANVGIAIANTGGNVAVGNDSVNTNAGTQNATGGAIATSNNGSVANVSDGSASIYTGDATAYGNVSDTTIDQGAHGALGLLTNQNAFVLNAGVGVANTGVNGAVGNTSNNTAGFLQNATNTTGLATNSAASTNASNGSATIITGAATATGNKSDTSIAQTGGGSGDGDPGGLLIIDQNAGVLNAGAGIANTGVNLAVGNASTNDADSNTQNAIVAPAVTAPLTLASNQLDMGNGSDGTAHIHTGTATATGNDSSTNLTQAAWGDPSSMGAIISTQAAGVANVGLGVANTGVNLAFGNVSDNLVTVAIQTANVAGPATTALLPVTASNAASSWNGSDGTGSVRTGDATATGNTSWTNLAQEADVTVGRDGMGVVPNVQTAGVLNAGAALANSGVNAAIGNASGRLLLPNVAVGTQNAAVVPGGPLVVLGPITASNSVDLSNDSDGTAKVGTGDATANGNTSATALRQSFQADADGMGLVVAPQTGVVVNAGIGVANSGVNAAVGNASTNFASSRQISAFDAPGAALVVGPVTVANSGEAGNSSDGEACVCTGDATASGNVSSSTLNQDVMVNVGDGITVLPTTGLILNLGLGVANSGVNLAAGNVSTNTATADQTADLPAVVPPVLVGPQTVGSSGGASNSSDGLGEVGTGKANAIGNLSDSELDQTAAIDGGGAVVAPMTSTIANAGLGLANSGVNLGVGNASTNTATLVQDAEGTGTVHNAGEASNESDGTGQVGDPDCEEDKAPPKAEVPGQPGVPTLPRTGGAIETMATVGLMLLLLGYGAQVASRRRVAAA